MGTWGPKLYQDDFALDIRDTFKDQLKRGKTGKQITEELIAEYESELLDVDDASIFWFALADTQWELGRLEETVKENALYYIREGSNLRCWEEDHKNHHKREKVLIELERKLLTPQPLEKKVTQHKIYKCEWQRGDVFAYQLEGEYAKEKGLEGCYFLFHKIDETTYWPGHIIPIVRVKVTKKNELPRNLKEFNDLEYVQTAVTRCDDPCSVVRGTSYVEGKSVESFVTDDISIPGFLWKFFDNIMIERYCGYNLGQYEIYAKRD